ncbi:MAG TPA: phosphoribosylformylglycinamidine synthase subunit PurL [Candidatus Binataceae bacterium]|nr:phosphoribosylformylglycinamidine synthase subunit PurL [Candidatus Binataceae bacterium]
MTLAGEPTVDLAAARSHGLSDAEYAAIVKLLGRTPSFTELGVFSVMWSEHCSYKSSRKHLRRLPMSGPRVVGGPGENAGAIDVGDGWVAVFKIESHNHPSFVEPYQGAATGVGGIIRDIFTMGARPLASMNSLKFGALEHPRTGYLLAGVVGGIGGYGNCVGVPTIAGEVMFDAAYNGNILVNAFCLGLARREDLQSAQARGAGNPVIYVGSATGRDGIHGASLLASAAFDAESAAKRPTVQVGDPFAEKLLIEACLEAMKTGAIVAIQDMGAAGLASSSSEMAGRGGLGIELELDRIPTREAGLTPYEMLLSESQERMLIVAERGREAELAAVFEKWDLHAPVVGKVTDDGRWRAIYRGSVVADIPVQALSDAAPVYDRPSAPPTSRVEAGAQTPAGRGFNAAREILDHASAPAALRALLASANVGSKRWVFRQYDSLVQSNTIAGPGGDAAILRIKGSRRGLALTVDSNPRACAIDPYLGAVATVCEAARNVACAGARPAGITNCLNYGNPERPEIMWQFIRGIEGLCDAAIAFDTPVISGNVSFYNETEGRAIPPTPTIAVVGILDEVARHVGPRFTTAGDLVLMVRTSAPSLAASEYAALFGIADEALNAIDLAGERRLIEGLIDAAGRGLISSAHDVSDGGLAVALAEACFVRAAQLGCTVEKIGETPAELFGEGASTVILSVAAENIDAIRQIFAPLEAKIIGRVTPTPRLKIMHLIDEDVAELMRIYEEALPRRLGGS